MKLLQTLFVKVFQMKYKQFSSYSFKDLEVHIYIENDNHLVTMN